MVKNSLLFILVLHGLSKYYFFALFKRAKVAIERNEKVEKIFAIQQCVFTKIKKTKNK